MSRNWQGQPAYQVIDAKPQDAPKYERPDAFELFKLGILSGVAFFVAAMLIAIAAGSEPLDALKIAVLVGGLTIGVVWPLLIFFYVSDDLGRTINTFLEYRLQQQRIAADREIALAQVEMQRAVSLANVEAENHRALVAGDALTLAQNRILPSGRAAFDLTEKILIEAVRAAYRMCDDQGWLPNDVTCPFGRRNLGLEHYARVRHRLAHPGAQFGVIGAPPVAEYVPEKRQWKLNLRAYPTFHDAAVALTGRRPAEEYKTRDPLAEQRRGNGHDL
ncbi:MAG: hypothetical protein Kow0047_34170 [Anaerolineae bacterium]